MLPSLEQIRQVPDEHFRSFLELHLNPISFAVLRRVSDLKILDLLSERPLTPVELVQQVQHHVGDPTRYRLPVEMAIELSILFGLIVQNDSQLELSDLSRSFLVRDAAFAMDGFRQHVAELQEGLIGTTSAPTERTAKLSTKDTGMEGDAAATPDADAGPLPVQRRAHARHAVQLRVEYPNREAYVPDWTVNLGTGGFFVQSKKPFARGDAIDVAIRAPGLEEPIEVSGLVAWVAPAATGQSAGVGVQIERDTRLGEIVQRARTAYIKSRTDYYEEARAYLWDSAILLMRAHLEYDLAQHSSVCDIGAAGAGFPCLLKKCFPALSVRALDFSYTLPDFHNRTRVAAEAEGVEVELIGADVLHDHLPTGADLITLNRVLSFVSERDVPFWLTKLIDALPSGGSLAIVDYLATRDEKFDRVLAHWWTLMMGWFDHLKTRGASPPVQPAGPGGAWIAPPTCDQISTSLRQAGFRDLFISKALPPFVLIRATKP
jgi:uncharacterized protein (TIGR02266 family)